MKGLIIIVSKLYEYASTYDNEWAVPEFLNETRGSKSTGREWSKSVTDGTELFSTSSGRYEPDCLVSTD